MLNKKYFYINTEWKKDLPYVLTSGNGDYVTVASGSVLTLEPGVIIKPISKFYTAMVVEGILLAEGASGSEIIFTSIKDDSFGGDTNNDGVTLPADGDWKSIEFVSGGGGTLDHVFIYYGTGTPPIIDRSAGGLEIKDTVDY